jgi:RNA polymerase sporulation-specific sigma factor
MIELIDMAKRGDKKAQSNIVEQNIGLVWSIVKKFYNRGYEPDDLFQVGCIGLLKAVSKFDKSFEVKFSTYAVPMIMGEIKRFIRDDGIIKVSRSYKELANKARVVKELLIKDLGREPNINEIAQKVGVEKEELILAMDAVATPESLYTNIHEGESSSIKLIDRLNCDERQEEQLIDKIALQQIINDLSPREKKIIILRYFKGKTQTQIAGLLGISQVQVSRIEKKILIDMKKKICVS